MMRSRVRWTKWQGCHGAVMAESVCLGGFDLSVKLTPVGKWEASVSKGGTTSLGEYDTIEEAQARCFESVRADINESFDALKQHEALVALGMQRKARRSKRSLPS